MYIIYYHPYVYFSSTKGIILFFNTLNGKGLEYKLCVNAKKIVDDVKGHCFVLSKELLKDTIFYKIQKDLTDNNMGGVIERDEDSLKLPFIPNKFNNIKFLNDTLKSKDISYGGDYSADYLHEIMIFLNINKFNQEPDSLLSKQYDYLVSPSNNKLAKEQLSVKKVKEIFFNGRFPKLKKIKVACCDLLRYEQLCNLITLAKEHEKLIEFFVFHDYIKNNIEKLYTVLGETCKINVIVFSDHIKSLKEYKKYNRSNFRILLFIKSESELNSIESNIDLLNGIDFNILSYYSNNLEFIRKYVFTKKSYFEETSHELDEFVKRELINPNYFGKLIIDYNGDVYSGFKKKKNGNIYKDNIVEIINTQFKDENSWRLTRKKVTPCSECNYSNICPPISNLERTLEKHNLCFNY